ncbi:MAG: UDP-N-acetylmuramoylalanyl-D-glutamyl-2, 6-diaminopimelate--D-alanyl-D-alanine ligase, partial [Pseudomonadota bacterium]
MTDTPLWSQETLAEAAGGVWDQLPTGPLTGFSLDSRMVSTGDVFVALKSNRDGHDFVPMAFDKGAGAALVSTAYVRQQEDGALLRVDDTLTGLERIGVAARGRLSADAFVLA